MFDHALLKVSDFARSKAFYRPALEALGLHIYMDGEDYIGFGTKDKLLLLLKVAPEKDVTRNLHLAFTAPTRKAVDDFYTLTLAAGGRMEGEPGLRRKLHEHYYAAFVIDPDGNNIEAVCHKG